MWLFSEFDGDLLKKSLTTLPGKTLHKISLQLKGYNQLRIPKYVISYGKVDKIIDTFSNHTLYV